MDPVSALMTAVQIARAIQGQLALMARNRADCADTGERLGGLVNVLEALKSNKRFIEMSSVTLQRLLTDMQKAQQLITTIQEASGGKSKKALLGAFFGAGNDSVQIAELNRRISQHVADLSPGIAMANAAAAAEDMSDVKSKLDRTTAMLEALQSLLIAASVTDAVAGPGTAQPTGPALRIKRSRPSAQQGEEDAGQAEWSDPVSGCGSEHGREDEPVPALPPRPVPTALAKKIGRMVEVAAHQFVFGVFMAGLSLTRSDAGSRATLLALSPLLPAGLMSGIHAAVLLHVRRLTPPGERQSVGALLATLSSRSLVPLQLYVAPTAGALAALAGTSFLGGTVGASITADFHVALGGVAVGVLVFAASYLASAG